MPASAPAMPRSGLPCPSTRGPEFSCGHPGVLCPRPLVPTAPSARSLWGGPFRIIPSLFRDGLLWPLSKNLTFSFPFQTSYSLSCLIFSLHIDYCLLYCALKKRKLPVASPDFLGWAIFIHFHQHTTTPHGMSSLNEWLTLVSSGEVVPLVILCLHLTWARWADCLSPP